MNHSVFLRFPFLCIFIAFLDCSLTVSSFSQSLLDVTQHSRSKRQAVYVQTGQSYRNWTSNTSPHFVPPDGPEYGPWGPWTESSQCSRTCGGGVAHQDRICIDTRPDGRHSCVGRARRYFSCNVQDCPPGSKDFRGVQCSRFNTVPYKGQYFSWLPYHQPNSPCELFCTPKGGNFYQKVDTKVTDGTKCRDDGSKDICVDGQCLPVGCDGNLGSSTREDECGVCGGDGSTCTVAKGLFDEDSYEVGYNDLLLIPVGATSILIQQVKPSKNFLAVRNSEGTFYLNGNWRIEFTRELRFAGTVFSYERRPKDNLGPETLRARGPTTEAIFIVLLYQERNPGIRYEYSVPTTTRTPSPDSYIWTTGDFEPCSQSCGGGVQHRSVRCLRESDRDILDERLCDPLSKPDENATCNNEPCPANWKIGEWNECTSECGGGTQFRLVYCYQHKDGNIVLVPDELCDQPKPLFMRSCNVDKECPDWITGEWSECDSACGSGNQNRTVECQSKDSAEIVEDEQCNPKTRPEEKQTCSLGPCEGVEWIVSDWSGCEGSCSPRLESREVHCANEEGLVFPNDACESSKMPELTRDCPKSTMCDPLWHTSEWTECSAKCGNGVQSRVVFCGTWEDNSVIKIDDENCDESKRFEDMQNCSADTCQGIWFTGPWNRCSVPCGGGERIRKILCFHEDEVVESSNCDPEEEPFDKETCNMTPCDDDEIMTFGGCKDSKYGCCPDGMTPAGLNYEGCNKVNISSTNESCEEAEFGCCSDGFTLALGPFKKGCPSVFNCNETKFGCCPDDKTIAKGLNMEGCPQENNCTNSTYGCCSDGITEATGPEMEGCLEEIDCSNTTFGCCSDEIRVATGPNMEGCETTTTVSDDLESSGEDCYGLTFGCCPDGLTPATGPEQEGCENIENVTDCKKSAFGCCDDSITAARGPVKDGCDEFESSGDGDLMLPCEETVFGCCPDNVTIAKGYYGEGCLDCSNTTFGCCPDNVTTAIGLNEEGCTINCTDSEFGCCPDNVTLALGPNEEGCVPEDCANTTYGCCADNITTALGSMGEGCAPEDCINTTYGCCPDNVTVALGSAGEGCDSEDCANTTYGCCPDNATVALGPEGEGCGPEDCTNTTYGCCLDNVTIALGPDGEGCPEDCVNTIYGCCPDNITIALSSDGEGCTLDDCSNSTYGCCSDNVTVALGPENEGCGIENCENSTYGCCPDNVTLSQGPNGEGCITDCTNSTFGCCPDNVTLAAGPDGEGCNMTIDCMETLYGCCPDNVSVSTGPDNEGCGNVTDCSSSEFGCCLDNITAALGSDLEGCNETVTDEPPESTTELVATCTNTSFGCCPDEITVALGPNLEGCCFGLRFGCCPDNKTAALGPNYQGCGCQTYPYGCCPDGINAAQGINYQGCQCEHFRYGCCQDNVTPAQGPNFEGCTCQFTQYGCCPDGRTPILNERGEGCGCDSTRYGCCPDGKTAATSADLSGCPCDTLPYGCCPDGHTPARTSDLRDCPCEAHRYGCCLDGRTIARGPEYEGCPCDSTRFGCCMDGKTTAQGPDFAGCPCHTTRYGCCADGYTPASGFHYEGCPDVQPPKPPVSTEVCSLPKEAGPCRNFTVKWFFDVGYGGCSRFWYGGCDGNGNVFANQEDCEKVCVKPEGPEICLLPKVTGSCDGKVPSWYFDAGSKKCETFTYGGCLGNNNRFVSKTDCEAKCISKQSSKPDGDKCTLPKDEGGCDSGITKWYYDGSVGRCEKFYYGGCKGNANRFESKRECEKSCLPTKPTEDDVCRLSHDIGPCNEFRERWYFDYESTQCHRFIYGGCDGNANNFASYPECERKCGQETDSELPTDEFDLKYCFMPQDTGPCSSSEVNWFYDSTDGVCKDFYYGGCKGNKNRFKTRKECETSCFKAQDMCNLAPVKGSCSGTFIQWYYDPSQDDCFEFTFGGCQGNANRFDSRERCQQRCKKVPVTTEPPQTSSDICSQSQDPGPCLGYYRYWYYDISDNACKSFVYGGCEGNDNRFEDRRDCEQRCVRKTPKVPVTTAPETSKSANEDVCRLPVAPGPCDDEYPRWFYDAQTQSCLPFVYGGCEGNKNRFKTAEICLRFCTGIKGKSGREDVTYVTPSTTTTTALSTTQCPPSNCGEIQCPYGIEESFDNHGCSSCRCSNPCEVQICPEGSRCAIDVTRTAQGGVRTEPVCRRVHKPGVCSSSAYSAGPRDCETRCRDDADCRGEYKCCNNGCAFTCLPPSDEPFVPATQPEPATILPGVNVTQGHIGQPAELPCNAMGWPKPTVTWWRDTTMLPLLSQRYEQLPNYALLIRSVVYEDGGDYSCHAHNGIGSGAVYKVTLIIDFQPEPPSAPRGEENDFNSRDSEPDVEPLPSPWDSVPVSAAVNLITSNPTTGSPLQVDCVAEGPPEAKVTWQFGDDQIFVDDRKTIFPNHTLYITKADISDSGEYKCTAQFNNNVATSSVYVTVRTKPTDSDCVDDPRFSNCNVIVNANYCNNKYYGKFCCASCMKAGQLQDMPVV